MNHNNNNNNNIYVVTNVLEHNNIYTVGVTQTKNDAIVLAMNDWIKTTGDDCLDHLTRDKLIEYVEKGRIKNKKLYIKDIKTMLEFANDIEMPIEEINTELIHIYNVNSVRNFKEIMYIIEKMQIV